MKQAKVIKISESGKSVLLAIKKDKMCYSSTLVYAPNFDFKLQQEIELPEDVQIVDWTFRNPDTGEIETRTTKGGVPLKVLA
jgi:hypothetical protein